MAALTGVRPGAATLDARFPAAPGPGHAVAVSLAALAASPFPRIVRWAVPIGGRWRKGVPVVPADAASLVFELADGSFGSVYHRWSEEAWSFTLNPVRADDPDALPRLVAACADAARSLFEAGAERISVDWLGAGALCLPGAPLVGLRVQVVHVTDAEVAEAYDEPERFWASGWQTQTRGPGGVLLTRAMEARDSVEYLRAVIPHQWKLARAAKPGRTAYGTPRLDLGEEEAYRAGTAVLHLVGYDPETAEVEYACALRAGAARVPGWQIFELYDLRIDGALADGRPVRGIRVVFLDAAAARMEKRPLLDVGARVLAYDDAGMLVELRD